MRDLENQGGLKVVDVRRKQAKVGREKYSTREEIRAIRLPIGKGKKKKKGLRLRGREKSSGEKMKRSFGKEKS